MVRVRTDHDITSTADSDSATEQDIHALHTVPHSGLTGEGVTVAVMDSGVDATHTLFDGMTIEHHDCTNTDTSDAIGHGTATAGLIAQCAPDVEIVSLKIFSDSGRTGTAAIKRAYEWLLSNADRIDVVNMSWGARRAVSEIDQLHRQLLETGIQDVVAAGNTSALGGSPATAEGAFSIGAVTEDGHLTQFSSYNPLQDNPDVCAIGKDVKLARAAGTSMGVTLDEEWVKASGTSFSAPIVTAFVARYIEAGGTTAVHDFEYTAQDLTATPEDGAGIAIYQHTIDRIKHDAPPTQQPSPLERLIQRLIDWLNEYFKQQ
jgi:subtilisin family serine protease